MIEQPLQVLIQRVLVLVYEAVYLVVDFARIVTDAKLGADSERFVRQVGLLER